MYDIVILVLNYCYQWIHWDYLLSLRKCCLSSSHQHTAFFSHFFLVAHWFCFILFLQALYKGATRVILATENDYCKLCDASFSSPAVAQAHYQGKNHAKKLRLAEAQQNSTNM